MHRPGLGALQEGRRFLSEIFFSGSTSSCLRSKPAALERAPKSEGQIQLICVTLIFRFLRYPHAFTCTQFRQPIRVTFPIERIRSGSTCSRSLRLANNAIS